MDTGIKEGLKKIRDLLSDPKRWTQKQYARDKDGRGVSDNDPSAVCWCLSGAMNTIRDNELYTAVYKVIDQATGSQGIIDFNDNATHEQVLALLDKVIDAY